MASLDDLDVAARIRRRCLPLLLIPLLAAGLVFGMKTANSERRIWLAQPALGLPAVGPVNSAPFSVQLHRAVAHMSRLDRRAERIQQRQIDGIRRYVFSMCQQGQTLLFADGHGHKVPNPREARKLCRIALDQHWNRP